MTDAPPPERRLIFGSVAERYEQHRPSYPQELVDRALAYSRLEPGERIVEVGAGTGKATRQFAAAGHPIVALEPSAEMAAVARITTAEFPLVSIIETEFESWPLPPEPFKLLISAQAWHWIDTEVRYTKARAALARGGALAPFWNSVDWQGSAAGSVLEPAYREAGPDFPPMGPMHPLTPAPTMLPDWETEIGDADGFEHPEVGRFPWRQRYSGEEYVRLLSTHSDHILLDPQIRERLFGQILDAIEAHGGVLEVPYVAYLCLARAV